MDVRLTRSYRVAMGALLPLTAGLGTLVLWSAALKWPRAVDEAGMTLRSGRRLLWRDVRKISVVRRSSEGQSSTERLDLHHSDGVTRVPARFLEDGDLVCDAIRSAFALSRARPVADRDLPPARAHLVGLVSQWVSRRRRVASDTAA